MKAGLYSGNVAMGQERVSEEYVSRSVDDELPSALALLIACVHARSSQQHYEHIRKRVAQGVSWERVIRLAHFHDVVPLLYHSLQEACGDHLPAPVKAHVERYQHTTMIHNTFLVRELGRLVARFEEHDIPMLALKGPVLAQVAYGDLHLRRYTDLDVLIPEERFEEAEAILQSNGYQPFQKVANLTGWRKQMYLYLARQWPFKRGRGVFNLDLHTRVMPPGYSYLSTFDTFWDQSRSVRLGEVTVQAFAPEDQLLILCYHGVKNQWRTLKYVADVGAVIEAYPDLDWSLALERAQSVAGERVLLLGVLLASRMLNVPIPDPVFRRAARQGQLFSIATKLITILRKRNKGRSITYGERVRLQLALQDSVGAQMRYGLYSLMRHIWSALVQPVE